MFRGYSGPERLSYPLENERLLPKPREAVILADDLADDAQFDLDWVYLTGDPTVDREAQRLRSRRREVSSAAEELAGVS